MGSEIEEQSAFENRAASARLPHTPGPWQSQHEFDWEGVCTIIGNLDGDPASPTYTTICDIDEGCDEFLANRNLICAAPDLLTALIELKEIVSRNGLAHSKRASAAIAKAEGK